MKMCLIASEFKIYIIVNIAAKSIETVVYIIAKKISKARTSLIIRNSSIPVMTIFICIILIIRLDNKKF